MKWKKCSQAQQDLFAYSIIGKKGTYVEIGGHLPVRRSNTYNLVVAEQWHGFSIEYDQKYKPEWERCIERNTDIFWADAINFDYAKAANDLGYPTHFNYLSVDIEPPSNTMSALKKVISDGLTFDVITFEHDRYQCDTDFHTIAKDFLSKDYKIAVYDVWAKRPERVFETWFVNKNIKFEPMSFDQWKQLPSPL
jgi:hypothetical protein